MNYRKEIQIVLKLGEIQKLKIAREVSFGVYLTDGEEEVLLPKKQVPEGAGAGDASVGQGRVNRHIRRRSE